MSVNYENLCADVDKLLYARFAPLAVDTYHYTLTDSTNTRAKEHLRDALPRRPVLFLADSQSMGRGRMGRSFFSPDNAGLYMTLLVSHSRCKDSFTRLTSLTAVAVRDAIFELFGIDTRIKWVNDIYLEGRKVAGILAESFPCQNERYIAVGIGINILQSEFPDEIADIAGALVRGGVMSSAELLRVRIDLAYAIVQRLLAFFECSAEQSCAIMNRYRQYSCVIGHEVTFVLEGRTMCGRVSDINDEGHLVLVLEDGGVRVLSTGEITLRMRN